MDIPELVRELLILKFRLNDNANMSIHINKDTISVQMWVGNSERWLKTMKMSLWATDSRSFLNECWEVAVYHKLLSPQGEFILR